MRRSFLAVPLLLVNAALGSSQVPEKVRGDGNERAPRFLVAMEVSKPPRPLDVARTPVLRRRISLELRNATLAEGLALVSRQAGLRLMYSRDVVPLEQRVTLEAKAITVAAALTELLLDADVDVVFSGTGQAVLVRRTEVRDVLSLAGRITGRVTDAKTNGVVRDVEVFLDGTRWRTTTDSVGRYVLAEVDVGSYTLIARRLGYAKQSRKIIVRTGRDDTVDVALAPVALPLDELVTTVTGQQRRRDLGNAVTTIRADSVMQTAPIKSLTDLLQDRVPGLTSQRTSGAPGDPSRVRLRGANSILRSNDPIVFVDGVRIYAAQTDARSGNLASFNGRLEKGPTQAAAPSPLDQIDPNSIETIEVFKGASAATLYGADASNGVIVVTTKRGRPGPPVWRASLKRGRSAMPRSYPLSYFRWGHLNDANTPFICPRTVPQCIQDSLVRFQALNDPELTPFSTGHRSAVSLSVSGGSQALTYSLTGSYSDEIGLLKLPQYEATRFLVQHEREAPDWMRRPHNYMSWSVTSNVNARISSAADVTISTSLSRSEQQRSSLESQLADMGGVYVDKANGLYYRPTSGSVTTTSTLPSAFVEEYYRRTTASTITFNTGAQARYRPRQWLDLTADAGVQVVPRDDESLVPTGMRTLPEARTDTAGLFSRGTGRSMTSTLRARGTANVPLRWGIRAITTIGADVSGTRIDDLSSSAQGLSSTTSLNGAASVTVTERRVGAATYGWFAETKLQRGSFTLPLGIRFDNSDANGANVGNVPLPKLALSWVASEEPFFPFPNLFSSLRLRASFGVAGRQPVPGDRYRLFQPDVGVVDAQTGEMLIVKTRGNTQLRPERSKEFEAGFEATMLDGRLELEVTGYRTDHRDLHLTVPTPPSVAIPGALTSMITNIGLVRAKGFESTITIQPIQRQDITWSMSLNVSKASNVVLDVGAAAAFSGTAPQSSGLVSKIAKGYPTTALWALPIVAVADRNGDGALQRDEIILGDSAVFVGNSAPGYTSSLFSNMSFFNGALSVSAGFNYDVGGTQADLASNWAWSAAFSDPSVPATMMASDVANTGFGRARAVSTFRFQSASVNYRMPARVAKLIGAQQMTVAVQASNLAMRSNYSYGRDPNVSAFGHGERTYDTGQLPLPREWSVAVTLNY